MLKIKLEHHFASFHHVKSVAWAVHTVNLMSDLMSSSQVKLTTQRFVTQLSLSLRVNLNRATKRIKCNTGRDVQAESCWESGPSFNILKLLMNLTLQDSWLCSSSFSGVFSAVVYVSAASWHLVRNWVVHCNDYCPSCGMKFLTSFFP